jgi:DNA-binding FadR family transcriptional regulator
MVVSVPAIPVSKFMQKYAYMQIADDIVRRINEGEIKHKLPSEWAMVEEYGASYTTVRRAMKELRKREVIASQHGRGTFVEASLRAGPDRWIAGDEAAEPDDLVESDDDLDDEP